MTKLLPPIGPSLSFDRFSIGPSIMSCTALDVVLAEKFIISFECVLGNSFSKLFANTVLPVPIAPTIIMFFFIFINASTMYEFRTVSTVGTIIS